MVTEGKSYQSVVQSMLQNCSMDEFRRVALRSADTSELCGPGSIAIMTLRKLQSAPRQISGFGLLRRMRVHTTEGPPDLLWTACCALAAHEEVHKSRFLASDACPAEPSRRCLTVMVLSPFSLLSTILKTMLMMTATSKSFESGCAYRRPCMTGCLYGYKICGSTRWLWAHLQLHSDFYTVRYCVCGADWTLRLISDSPPSQPMDASL
jgi:hypothetical protein